MRAGGNFFRGIGLATMAAVTWANAAAASDIWSSWMSQDTATGTWGGVRTDLQKAGVTPALNFTTDLQTNPVGGLEQDGAYAGMWVGSLAFDLETIVGVPGLSLFAAGASTQGRDLSGDAIGNVFGVAEVFNGNALRLSQLYLQQNLYDDTISLAVGRLAAGDDFAASDSYAFYVSAAANGNPTSILVNAPSFTTAPFTQWGARATINPSDQFYVSAGAYNADPEVQADDKHGVDFRLNPEDGVLTLAEVGYTPTLGQDKGGLPGSYALGGYYDSSVYEHLDDAARTETGNYGIYVVAEQMLYREMEKSDQGLTAWTTLTFGPNQSINTLPIAAYGGTYYKGLSHSRPDDVTALAFYYGAFSGDLPDQSYELVLEANHRFQYAPWLYITPDVQYVINPNGGGIPNAAVFGLEISIDF